MLHAVPGNVWLCIGKEMTNFLVEVEVSSMNNSVVVFSTNHLKKCASQIGFIFTKLFLTQKMKHLIEKKMKPPRQYVSFFCICNKIPHVVVSSFFWGSLIFPDVFKKNICVHHISSQQKKTAGKKIPKNFHHP